MNRKQILVTGASRGIGKACAIHFAKEGWHVFLNCSKSISELQATADFITKETSGSCEILPGDVGVPSEVGRIFDQIEMSGSGLDVLINNAGIAWMGLLTDMSIEEWNRMISTNLSSASRRSFITVSMTPQAIALTWILLGASSFASARVRPFRPDLVAE